MLVILSEYLLYFEPTLSDISGCAPAVSDFRSPLPWILAAPITNRVVDGSARLQQGVPHLWVSLNGWNMSGILAIVVFEIVYAPVRPVLCVYFFVA